MSDTRASVASGGCQCGAVRYELLAEPERHSICWCRMCQKASGSYLLAHTGVKRADFSWSRGTPGTYRSSIAVERDFCRDCGTALTYRNLGADRVSVSIATLDQPYRYVPQAQYGVENRPAFAVSMASLHEIREDDWKQPEHRERYVSRQHPDHDTDAWPER